MHIIAIHHAYIERKNIREENNRKNMGNAQKLL